MMVYAVLICYLSYSLEGNKLPVTVKVVSCMAAAIVMVMFIARAGGYSEDVFYVYNRIGNISETPGVFEFLVKENFLYIRSFWAALYGLYIYIAHSLNSLSEFLNYANDTEPTYGVYQFSAFFRFLSKYFSPDTPHTIYYFIRDPSVGRYATIIRDMVADFGTLGFLLQSFGTGLLYALVAQRRHHPICYPCFIWLTISYLFGPFYSVLSIQPVFIGGVYLLLIFLVISVSSRGIRIK
jgi:hypothetical protein